LLPLVLPLFLLLWPLLMLL
jgi:hypothetical protein